MIGIHGKHPLRITQQNSDPGTEPTAQMFPIKKFASSLNGKFQLCFSFKFLFDPSGGKKKQNSKCLGTRSLQCCLTQSSRYAMSPQALEPTSCKEARAAKHQGEVSSSRNSDVVKQSRA